MQVYRNRLSAWMIITALLLSVVFPSGAFAATGDVLSIEIEGSSSLLELAVGKTTKQLKVWATLEGSTVKRDVTGNVTWESNDASIVKVVNGFLTPLKAGTTVIKATHGGAVSTIQVKAIETYKKLDLSYSASGKYILGDNESLLKVKASAKIQTDSTTSVDVTEDVEWSSSNTAVLTVSKGKLTLVGEGTATVTAKYAGLTATFKATVSSPYSSLKLTKAGSTDSLKELELVVGDYAFDLSATVTEASTSTKQEVTKKATWTSSDKNVATIEDGKLSILSSGRTTLKAEYLGVSAEVIVYVRSPYEAIILKPSEDTVMFIGERLQAKAEVRSGANITQDVTPFANWTSSDKLPVTVNNGVIEAKAIGNSVVKVSYQGISRSVNVKVLPTVTKLAAEQSNLDLLNGDVVKLPTITATKLDEETTDFSTHMEWSSENEEIAKISEEGKLVAKAAGTTVLTASFPSGSLAEQSPIRNTTIKITVNIKEKVLTMFSEQPNLVVVVGEDQALPDVTVVWEDGNKQEDFSSNISWKLTGTNGVLKETAKGTRIKGLTPGSGVLRGTYSNKEISIPITFEQKITKIVVDAQTISLNIKKSKSIKVTGYYKDGKTVNLSRKMNWQLSNTDVAALSYATVRGLNEGTVVLTGSYQGHNATVIVNVVPKLKKLTTDAKKINLAPGASRTVIATAEYDTGVTAAVTSSLTWSSSNSSVAKVTAGRIEAVAKGTARIKGTFEGKTVNITVTVK